MTSLCAGVHAPDDGRELLIPIGHYLRCLVTGRSFRVVFDRATDERIPAATIAAWNANDPPRRPPVFRYGAVSRAPRDLLDALEFDVLYPALDRAAERVERRCQPWLARYLRHRADLADLDASVARCQHDAQRAGMELNLCAVELRAAADALVELPISYDGPVPLENLEALATARSKR